TQAPASVASGAPPTAAPPSVASAPPTDAPASVESRAPATEVAAREFMLRSEPDKARVIDLATGESVGTTYLRVAISKETTYIFKKTGYLEQRVTLSPDDPETQKKIVLKPRPEAVKPEAPPTKTTVTVRRPPPESPPTRAPVASPKTADVPIELQ
ncbi:MAG: hypothetical protein KC549_09510, partial [Myxococcales bacterium]|nr:hypothetical protein [Myxococcales bacterium]